MGMYDDEEDDGRGRSSKNKQGGDHVQLVDFVVPAKINAFVNAYAPLDRQEPGCEVFNDTDLRRFFKAYTCSLGDPLSVYVSMLELYGYKMVVTLEGEPAFCVRRK